MKLIKTYLCASMMQKKTTWLAIMLSVEKDVASCYRLFKSVNKIGKCISRYFEYVSTQML